MHKSLRREIERAAFLERDDSKVRRLCLQGLTNDPDNPWLLTRLSAALYHEGKDHEALKVSTRAYQLAPNDPTVLWDYAHALDAMGQRKNAVEVYKRIVAKGERSIGFGPGGKGIRWARSLVNDSRYAIALCYEAMGKYDQAIKWLKLHLKNRSVGVLSMWTRVDARRKLRNLQQRNETRGNIQMIEKFYDGEKWAQAQRLIETELKKSPNDVWLLAQLSSVYYEQHRYRKAMNIINRAVDISPNEPLVLWHYAGALDALGHPSKAIDIYKRILRKPVERIAFTETTEGLRWAKSLRNDCRFRLGLCYKDMGQVKMAAKCLRSHLRNRRPGLPSIYPLPYVKKCLSETTKSLTGLGR